MTNPISVEDARPKLKLQSKKLKSGKVQVKFSVSAMDKKKCYGYVLAEARSTLRDVVKTIEVKLASMENTDNYYHKHLYSLNKIKFEATDFVVFKEN